MAKRAQAQPIQRRVIRSQKDLDNVFDELFPERIVERQIPSDFLSATNDDLDREAGAPAYFGDDE